jgi:quercetin dioxygenase-like cupin family protein
LALGTQQVPVGGRIPIHRHAQMDEVFYVVEGSGTFILNDARLSVEKGATVFVPKGSWHGFDKGASMPQKSALLCSVLVQCTPL